MERKWQYLGIFLALLLFSIWIIAPLVAGMMFEHWGGKAFDSSLGSFGDSYAVFNSLVSGLALAAIVIAIWIQAEQLKAQKEEISRTLENLEKQELAEDIRFTIDSAPILQKLLLDEIAELKGQDWFLNTGIQLDPESTSLESDLQVIAENVFGKLFLFCETRDLFRLLIETSPLVAEQTQSIVTEVEKKHWLALDASDVEVLLANDGEDLLGMKSAISKRIGLLVGLKNDWEQNLSALGLPSYKLPSELHKLLNDLKRYQNQLTINIKVHEFRSFRKRLKFAIQNRIRHADQTESSLGSNIEQ